MSIEHDETELLKLLAMAQEGNSNSRDALLMRFRRHLKNMIKIRLNRNLQRRLDASDIVQEVMIEANRKLDDYLESPKAPFLLWIRRIASDKILEIHRNHLQTKRRSIHRELVQQRDQMPLSNSNIMARTLVARANPPLESLLKSELEAMLKKALLELPDVDREILSLRHFEHLSNVEAAQELGLEPSATSKRYLRALARIRCVLKQYGAL